MHGFWYSHKVDSISINIPYVFSAGFSIKKMAPAMPIQFPPNLYDFPVSYLNRFLCV